MGSQLPIFIQIWEVDFPFFNNLELETDNN
jgi:hypothetical protein